MVHLSRRDPDIDELLEILVERHRLVILKVFFGYLGDAHVAEDLAQEVFIRALESLRAGHSVDDIPRAWLIRVATNLAHDYARSAWRRRVDTHAVLPDIAETGIELPTELIKQEEADELWRALQHVKQWQREVIILHYYQAYDLATMVHILGHGQGSPLSCPARSSIPISSNGRSRKQ